MRLFALLSSLCGSTGRTYGADDCGAWRNDSHALIAEVACDDLLADAQRSRVNLKSVRKILEHCRNFELACGNQELAAELYACRVAGNDNRNVDSHRLLRIYSEEVHVESLVGYRMPLRLVKYAKVFLALEIKLDDI